MNEDWEGIDDFIDFFTGERIRVIRTASRPPMNFYETEDEFVLLFAIPGVRKEDIRIDFQDGCIFLRGMRKPRERKKPKQYHAMEILFGPFERIVYIGEEVEPDQILTSYEEGILEIRVPKRRKKEIEIEIEEG